MSRKKKPIVMDFSELEAKTTKELLGYLKRLQECEESFEKTDLTENPDVDNEVTIYFKQTDKWKIAYENVKSILKNRPHIN